MSKKKYTLPIIIFCLAAGLRLLYIFQMQKNDPFFYHPFSDVLQYHQLALSVLKEGIIGTSPFYHAPLYHYFIAAIYALFGADLLVARVVQALLGAVNCALIYILAHHYFNRTVSYIAGFIASAYPMLIFYDGELLIPTFLIFLILVGLYLIQQDSTGKILLAGIVFGLAAITRQNMLIFIILFPLYLLIKHKKVVLKYLILFWGGSLLMIVPVALRNTMILKEPILISWQGGVNFYIGNNPDADGITGIPPGSQKRDWYNAYLELKRNIEQEVNHAISFSEFDLICYKKGAEFILHNPIKALGLFIKKCYLFFSGFEISSERDLYYSTNYSFLKFILFKIPFLQFPFGILFPLSLVGVYYTYERWREICHLFLFVICYSASFILFFVNARYRIPIIPILIIFAAYGIFRLFREKDNKRFILLLILFFCSFFVFNANFYRITDPNPYLTEFQVAETYLSKKQYDRALRTIETSIRHDPLFAESHNLRGLILKSVGKIRKAEEEFLTAIDLDSHFAEPYINLGNLFIHRGDLAKAEFYYKKAIEADSASPVAYNNLGNVYFQRGRYDDALRLYGNALKRDPEYTSPLYHAGLIYYKRGGVAKAESLWRLVLEIDEAHSGAQKALKMLAGEGRDKQ